MDQDFIDQLQALEVDLPSEPDSALLMVQTGDDILDYREAVSRYSDSPMVVQEGGSHGFDHFEEALPGIMTFFRGASEYQ